MLATMTCAWRVVWLCVLLMCPGVLGGCLSPAETVPASPSDPPQLKAIRARFDRIIEDARNDTNTQWHSSWTGNMFVNALKGRHRGLCYQWQDYVYRGVSPEVARVGWACTGLVANAGNTFEHHVVLVWDPKLISREEILTRPSPPARPVYVLDAWYEAKANIHWLDVWLKHEAPHRVPPALQELPAEYEDPSDPITFDSPQPNAGSGSAK